MSSFRTNKNDNDDNSSSTWTKNVLWYCVRILSWNSLSKLGSRTLKETLNVWRKSNVELPNRSSDLWNCVMSLQIVQIESHITGWQALRGDTIEAYNIRTGREKEKKEDFFIFSDTDYNLRGHCYKLAITCSRLEVRCNFFSQRVVGPWNLLPAHIIKAPTLNAFKNRYDSQKRGGHHKADASMPDTYKYK